jgi:hypothetical protein
MTGDVKCLGCGAVGPWPTTAQDAYVYGGLDHPDVYRDDDGNKQTFVLCDACYESAMQRCMQQESAHGARD